MATVILLLVLIVLIVAFAVWSENNGVRRTQELRRSNAAGIHKGQGEYTRRPKHMGRGWDSE